MRYLIGLVILFLPCFIAAQENVLNLYIWSGELPSSVIRQFEKETGIKVNVSTYDNNEIMYTKLRTMKHASYDIVLPSSYFVERMGRQNMLEPLDKRKVPNYKNLNPSFLNPAYDPESKYGIPHVWGVTGIFYNSNYFKPGSIKKWADLWDARFQDQLMLLDDTREIFSIGLMVLGYSPNDKDPEHIKAAFLKLKTLIPNVKVFSSDMVVSNIIDEDANVGTAWNGDTFKAQNENKNVNFVFPEEGFVIWVDNFVIPKNAAHKDNAYLFLNYVLRSDIGKEIALYTHYPTANLAAQKMLPKEIRDNAIVYPSKDVMKRGKFQRDVGEDTLAVYEKYWEQLKMSS